MYENQPWLTFDERMAAFYGYATTEFASNHMASAALHCIFMEGFARAFERQPRKGEPRIAEMEQYRGDAMAVAARLLVESRGGDSLASQFTENALDVGLTTISQLLPLLKNSRLPRRAHALDRIVRLNVQAKSNRPYYEALLKQVTLFYPAPPSTLG